MYRFGRAAVMALLGSIMVTGVVAPGSAGAAPTGIKVKLCNKTNKDSGAEVGGLNVNGKWMRVGPALRLLPSECLEVRDYRSHPSRDAYWAKDQWLKIYISATNAGLEGSCHLKKSIPDGSTQQCNILRTP
ncbi:hypothetical protein UK23_05355 [Lentzea aerocolonigenes]|uniref:Secreted protein n=1 Tax=Lentzea aerocolonigenes TaxID=68170 RepID=A0A0F0HE75_LENAE|nr:hypothetical protein [Lentzea aerocolonigenes]KJK51933.1 hypothetical protein UK23_05355 [Lentzea aerocolonigenes]